MKYKSILALAFCTAIVATPVMAQDAKADAKPAAVKVDNAKAKDIYMGVVKEIKKVNDILKSVTDVKTGDDAAAKIDAVAKDLANLRKEYEALKAYKPTDAENKEMGELMTTMLKEMQRIGETKDVSEKLKVSLQGLMEVLMSPVEEVIEEEEIIEEVPAE